MSSENTESTVEVSREELLRSSGKDSHNPDVGRRGVVKGLLGSVATVVGLSSTSKASSEPNQISRVTSLSDTDVIQKYTHSDAIREVFREHEDMLEVLSEQSALEASSAAQLKIDDSRIEGDERLTTRQINGQVTPEIQLFRRTDRGGLTVAIQPETGERYAVLAVDGEPHVMDEVTTSGCSDSCCDEVLECCAWDTPDCGGTACEPYCVSFCYTCGNCECNTSCLSHCI